jgi:RNA polymerase sigma-70 factor, ECF subfamily
MCTTLDKYNINTFTNIYKQYYKKAFFFVKSYVHDDSVAEDITSDSLIKLWEKLKTKDIDYVEPLLLSILKNSSLDYLKHEEVKRVAFKSITDWHYHELSIRIASLEACNPDEIFSSEIESIIHDTLASLPKQTRRAFILSRFKDKSNKEISGIMHISVKGVEYHISKSLKVMRIALKDYLPLLSLSLLFYLKYYFKIGKVIFDALFF